MKNLRYYVLFAMVTFQLSISFGHKSQVLVSYKIEQQQNIKKVKITVSDMTCQKGCADGIDKKLKTVNGIIRSKTKLETGISMVTYDEKKISVAEIVKIIEAHGYPAKLANE